MKKNDLKKYVLQIIRQLNPVLYGPKMIRICPFDYLCNLKCKMCFCQHLFDAEELKYLRKSERDRILKLEDYKALFEFLPPGLEMVDVTGGGEPLLHPQVIEIMKLIKKKRLRGSLISNGTLMNEEISHQLIKMKWNSIRISVNAGDSITYKKICGVDRFRTIKNNLKTFTRLRQKACMENECILSVFFVIQRENIPTIHKLFEFAEDVGADQIVFEKIRPHSKKEDLNTMELQTALKMIETCAVGSKVPSNLKDILLQLKLDDKCIRENKPFVPGKRCFIGFRQSFITAQGYVLPCCFSNEVMGNVKEKSLSEIWYSEKYREFRRRLLQGKFAQYCIRSYCSLPEVLDTDHIEKDILAQVLLLKNRISLENL